MDPSQYNIVSANIHAIQQSIQEHEKTKKSKELIIFLNTDTGSIEKSPPPLREGMSKSQKDTNPWKAVHLSTTEEQALSLDLRPLSLTDHAKSVVQATLGLLSNHTESWLALSKPQTILYNRILERFKTNRPIDKKETAEWYASIEGLGPWETHKLQQDNPIQTIIRLHSVFSAYDLHPSSMKPTGSPLPKDSADTFLDPETPPLFSGANQSFFLSGTQGERLWVFKPGVGEAGKVDDKQINAGINPGTGFHREHLSWVLNYHGHYPIPVTLRILLGGEEGSAQQFVQATPLSTTLIENPENQQKIDLDEIQNLLVFDIRFRNTDRHQGNILLQTDPQSKELHVVAIDQGGCMTSSAQDPLKMDYVYIEPLWEKFTEQTKAHIRSVSTEKDAQLMREAGIEEDAIQWMETSTKTLRTALDKSDKASQENASIQILPRDLGFFFLCHYESLADLSQTEALSKALDQIIIYKQIVVAKNSYAHVIRQARKDFPEGYQTEGTWGYHLMENIIKPYFDRGY